MKNQGGSSQDRRRARRAAEREVKPAPALEEGELAEFQAIAASGLPEPELAPEDRALATLEAELEPAVFRFIIPQDAVDEAATILASRARLADENEVSGDFAAALEATLAARADDIFAEMSSRGAGTFGEQTTIRLEVSSFDVALPAELEPGETLPAPGPTVAAPEAPTLARGPAEWTAVFVPEATLTDDGRAFAPDALTWRELPLTLMGLNETSAEGGHDGAVACGRIDRIWRDGHLIRAAGVFSEDDMGNYFATNVGDGTIRGLSVDIAIAEYEVGPKSDYFDEDGNWNRAEAAAEEPTLEDVLFGEVEDRIFVVTKAVIGMATVCPFPAFAGANISLLASGAIWSYTHQGGFTVVAGKPVAPAAELAPTPAACANCDHAYAMHDGTDGACTAADCSCMEYVAPDASAVDLVSLTAAAAGLAPLKPPLEWFQNPELTELTPLTIDDDGRVYGHAWPWGSCHTGLPGCETAPHSLTNYAYFRTGEIECENGERVAVGPITFDTGHAGRHASKGSAIAHYDDTGKIGAFVVVGEDEFGGWVAGTLAATISAEDAQKLRGAAPSGDWRAVDGNLELIGLLAVNIQGFPVPRPRALVASLDDGPLEPFSLTAAGVAEILRERTPEDDFRDIEALAAEAAGEFAELAAQARG